VGARDRESRLHRPSISGRVGERGEVEVLAAQVRARRPKVGVVGEEQRDVAVAVDGAAGAGEDLQCYDGDRAMR